MNKIKAGENRNCSIDIFRYVCAVMVIALHTNPFREINPGLAYIVTPVLSRVAVPFFFAVSGYYYIQKLESGQKPFLPYIKRIIAVYLFWSLFYFVFDYLNRGRPPLGQFLADVPYSFFVSGSYYHLWYFPALIFSVCAVTLIYRLGAEKLLPWLGGALYVLGCLGCSYYKLAAHLFPLSALYNWDGFTAVRQIFMTGFPFFSGGCLIWILNKKAGNAEVKKARRLSLACFAALFCLWLLENHLVKGIQKTNVLTFGLYFVVVALMLLLLRFPFARASAAAGKLRFLSGFTFYTHPFFMVCVKTVWGSQYHTAPSQTVLFFLTWFVTLAAGYLFSLFNSRVINRLAG